MYAKIAPDFAVIFFFANGNECTRKAFQSFNEAEAALIHAGWMRTANDLWVFSTNVEQQFCATLSLSIAAEQELDYNLTLQLVNTPSGFGFRFDFAGYDIDPVIYILTSGLFSVQAIGTWSTVEAARGAGLELFRRVKELVGESMWDMLWKIMEERWRTMNLLTDRMFNPLKSQ